jgi:hypothetical protein
VCVCVCVLNIYVFFPNIYFFKQHTFVKGNEECYGYSRLFLVLKIESSK